MKLLYIILFSILFSCNITGQKHIYVSPTGNDSNPGTKHKPVASIKRVQEIINEIESRGNFQENGVEVILDKGTYNLSDTISITNSHTPIKFKSAPGENVIITTGVSIAAKNLTEINDDNVLKLLSHTIKTRIKEIDLNTLGVASSDKWPNSFRGYSGWPEIYIDDKPLQLSRWPNEGYVKIEKVVEKGSQPRNNEIPVRPGVFTYKEENQSSWDTNQEIYLGGYWCYKWYDEIIKVDNIDKEKREISLAAPHHYGIGGPSGGLYYAMNLIEEIDQPGEYVFDRKENKIYLLLPEYANSESQLEISFKQGDMFSVKGSRNITFEGITFSTHSGNIFNIKNSNNIVFNNCTFKNISGTAIAITGGKQCGLNSCHIFNIGESGAVIDGGKRESLEPSSHFAVNCHLHNFARHIKTYRPAFEIKGVGQKIISNYIHDAPHSAILFWGNDHLIEKNRIERVCLNTSDAGAIYTGRDWTFGGNIIRKNYIAALGAASHHHNWGIYLDDMAAGIEVSENIIANSPSGILVGGGRNNIIKNNLIINVPLASIIYDSRAMGWAKYHVKKYSGIMWQRLYAMPYDKSPWKERFPYLMNLDNDKAAQPRHNTISNNFFINSPSPRLDKVVIKNGVVENNVQLDDSLTIDLENGKIRISPSQEFLTKFEEINFPLNQKRH
jgi:hypothetical protein